MPSKKPFVPQDKTLTKCPKCGATRFLYPKEIQYSFDELSSGQVPLVVVCYAELKTGPDKGFLCRQEFWYDPRSRKITVKK